MNIDNWIDYCRLSIKKNNKENNTSNFQNRNRFQSTQDIIDAAYEGWLPNRIMITVHPQRWSACPVKLISLFHGDSFLPWIKELVW
ncbi:hypothetical protein H8E88_04770 [candidate division KSB1 bacterium]|nr:hypothetical protein [candidate division KSB1 bacterium]